MPSGPRIRANNLFGTITDNPLTSGATSFNSAALFQFPTVSSAHAIVVLDPKRVNGEPEIVVMTAHTALATSATITRGAYGTTARSHPVGTTWAHVAVTDDMIPVVTSSTRPSDPFEGQHIYETDTHRPVHRDNTQWLPGGPTSVVTSSARPANPYDGQQIYETDTDLIKTWNGSGWVNQSNLRMIATGANLTGVGPPAVDGGASFKMQAGTTVLTSAGDGFFDLTFPTPFPNGLINVIVCPGSTGAGDWTVLVSDGGFSTSGFRIRTFPGSILVRIHWLATGW